VYGRVTAAYLRECGFEFKSDHTRGLGSSDRITFKVKGIEYLLSNLTIDECRNKRQQHTENREEFNLKENRRLHQG